jgi:hypothetical protein
MTRNLSEIKLNTPSVVLTALLITVLVFGLVGLFAWWAFSFSTHTLVWLIFIFGSVLGSVRIRAK